MATLELHVEALITELTRVQAPGSIPRPDEEGFSFPGQIAVGDDRFIMTTREMERLIELSSRELKRSDPTLSRSRSVSSPPALSGFQTEGQNAVWQQPGGPAAWSDHQS